ncbi:MAG: glycosyltransferase family 4 protein [Arcobacteraceae bacterium]|nr:glycosyltransferase family 4 protein [Arcobacteraceae bacterium]
MKKKKILIVTECFYPEEFKINDIALSWKKKGYDVDVLTMVPTYPQSIVFDGFENKLYQKNVWNDINIYRVKAVTGYRESLFKKLLKYFTFMILGSFISLKIGKKYDYIFGFDVGALTGMVPAILVNKFYNKPVTLWIQDVWPDSVYAYGFKKTKILEFFLNGFVKFVYRNTTNFAISSKGFHDKILPYIDVEKTIQYSPNWADEFNRNLELFQFSEDKKVHFTFAGNVGKVQNLDNIITSFGSLSWEYLIKVQLNIIGDGSELDNLKSIVKNNNYKNIVFWGKQPRDEMYKYFKASNFLIVSLVDKPIFSLTVPAKVQTYIAASKPILAVINGDAADIIKENNLGFVAKPTDIEEINNIFRKATDVNENESLAFSKNCDTLTKTTFDKDNIINNLLDLLVRSR